MVGEDGGWLLIAAVPEGGCWGFAVDVDLAPGSCGPLGVVAGPELELLVPLDDPGLPLTAELADVVILTVEEEGSKDFVSASASCSLICM